MKSASMADDLTLEPILLPSMMPTLIETIPIIEDTSPTKPQGEDEELGTDCER